MQQYVCDYFHWARFNTEGRVRNRSCCYWLSAILACLFYPVYGFFLSIPISFRAWFLYLGCCCKNFNFDASGGGNACAELAALLFYMAVLLVPLVPIFVGTYVYGWGLFIYSAFKFRTVPVIRLPKGHKEDEQIE